MIKDSVKGIDSYAFYDCASLTNIIISSSVTHIAYEGFEGCISLQNVYYTGDITDWCEIRFDSYSSNPMYYGAKFYINGNYVTHLIIPDGITSIGEYAFSGGSSITSITIPESVTSVGYAAFYDCTSLKDVYYTGDIVGWCGINFEENDKGGPWSNPLFYGAKLYIEGKLVTDLVVPDCITSIGNTFKGYTSLVSVTIPDSVTSIGSYAFEGCTSLTTITIPDSVTSIGDGAFYGCTSIKEVYYTGYIASWCTINFVSYDSNPLYNGANLYISEKLLTDLIIPDGVTILSSAFSGCTSLTSVTIPDSVTSIVGSAFSDCTSLTSITIPESVMSIGSWSFYRCTSLKYVYYTGDIAGWCGMSFGGDDERGGVTANPLSNGAKLYINGKAVTNILIPNGVKNIKDNAFSGYTSLTSVTIPDSVTSIGYEAFYGCTSLTSITISDSVTSIEACAFEDCTSLTSIKYRGTSSQWSAISKGSWWNRDTGAYTITYNYTGA